ncbi:MAG: glutathione-disulfide reductase [Gammaproteobacteria bacterium]|jgi:glutathione reductase (NADPH)
MHDFDLFVIGAGSAGVRAARTAAALGVKVAIAEDKQLGGTCVNVGCVPKKLYSYASQYSADFVDARGFGWQLGHVSFDWATLRDNKIREISRLNGIYENLLLKAGVSVLTGRATLTSATTVKVQDQQYRARYILICSGGRPERPSFPGQDLTLSSDQIFDLPELPKRMLVLGAGYIGVEFAGIFAGLGVKTWLSWRSELPLRGFDEDVRKHFMAQASKHCQMKPSSQVRALVKSSQGGLVASFVDDSTLEVDLVLAALGRAANVEGLGLANTRVELTATGHIAVDASFCTAETTIYAIGDVVGHKALTPVALAEAMLVVRQLFGTAPVTPLDYQGIATAVFAHPNIATVGLTESQAREQVRDVAIYETDFRPLRHTLSGRSERAYMKVVVNSQTDQVLGIHMVGEHAAEIMQGFAVAMTCGLRKAQLDATLGIHPTMAEELVTLRTRSR